MNFKHCKRAIVSLMMAVVMLTTCVSAADYTASIMRLEKSIGFCTITNSIGTVVTVRDGGRMYSGYEVKTGLGYAWISLDDSKVIKLGWNTKVTLSKTGNKLEVLVDSGEIFFDISEALDEDESLAIRTSTMYSGIRGTSGTVSVRTEETTDDNGTIYKEKISTLTVYDGTVAATTVSNDTSAPQTEMVSASQQAVAKETITESEATTPATKVTIEVIDLPVVEALAESPFAAVEVAENAALQERIEQANQPTASTESTSEPQEVLDLSSVLETAQDALTAQEEAVSTQVETTTQTVEVAQEEVSTGSNQVEAAFPSTSTTTNSSSNSGNSSNDNSDDDDSDDADDPVVTPPATYIVTYEYEDATFATLDVTSGECAVSTVIYPTASGYWSADSDASFSFDTPITADITLYWVDSPFS